ncbi:MAG: PIN domain-containing protein [Candidatus Micrarchaeia archaeon]
MNAYIADTYAWFRYLEGGDYKELLEDNEIETPSIVLAELTRVLLKKNVSPALVERIQQFIQKNSLVLQLDAKAAVKAGGKSVAEGLSLTDAIIYSYASEEKPLLTGDKHFRGNRT